MFVTTELCREHERVFHNITIESQGKGHVCQYCNKVMSNSSNLSAHIRIKHAKTSNLMCPRCQQPFLHRQRYEKHIKSCTAHSNWSSE